MTSALSSAYRRTFEKFLVSGDGTVVARFSPQVEPEDERIISAIKEQLTSS